MLEVKLPFLKARLHQDRPRGKALLKSGFYIDRDKNIFVLGNNAYVDDIDHLKLEREDCLDKEKVKTVLMEHYRKRQIHENDARDLLYLLENANGKFDFYVEESILGGNTEGVYSIYVRNYEEAYRLMQKKAPDESAPQQRYW